MSFVLGLIAGLLIAPNILRWRRRIHVNLGTNCLLTWHPIVFFEGPKSLFYFGRYWNRIPDYLREIGYDVRSVRLGWRNKSDMKKRIQAYLDDLHSQGKQAHIFADDVVLSEFESTLLNSHPAVATINKPEIESNTVSPIDYITYPGYRLHNWMLRRSGWKKNFEPKKIDALPASQTSLDKTLEQVIHLAEEDFIGSQPSEQTWN